MEKGQTGPGRDGRIYHVRPNSQAQTGKGKNTCSSLQFRTSRIGNQTRLIRTLLNVLTILNRTTPRHRAARMLACHIMKLLLPEYKSRPENLVTTILLGVGGLFIPPLCLTLVFDILTVFSRKSKATSPSRHVTKFTPLLEILFHVPVPISATVLAFILVPVPVPIPYY